MKSDRRNESGADLVIFDCDGVLVDSEPIANRVLQEALAGEGLELGFDEVVERYVGRSMTSVTQAIERELGRPLAEGWVDRLQARTFHAFRERLQPVAGIHDALDRIERPTCVASSGEHDKMRLTLALTGLWDRFAGRIYSATEVARGKPAPDLFLHAASRSGHDPARATVVEDSPAGVEAAVSAGMRALGFAARGQAAVLAAAGASVTFDDMALLPGLLDR